MTENLCAEPGTTRRDDDKESIVDIYVSAESLRVYENPWVESMSPNIATGAQYPGMDTKGMSNRCVCKLNRVNFFLCLNYTSCLVFCVVSSAILYFMNCSLQCPKSSEFDGDYLFFK